MTNAEMRRRLQLSPGAHLTRRVGGVDLVRVNEYAWATADLEHLIVWVGNNQWALAPYVGDDVHTSLEAAVQATAA